MPSSITGSMIVWRCLIPHVPYGFLLDLPSGITVLLVPMAIPWQDASNLTGTDRLLMRNVLIIACFFLWCCGDANTDSTAMELVDAGMVPVDAGSQEVVCNMETRRAELEGALSCRAEPEYVRVIDNGRPFHIFKYEASHPLATGRDAFPCAATQGESFQAPDVPTEACSVSGVVPWHSVKWKDADAACEAIGWRLCEEEELIRSCAGPDGHRYTFGPTFEPGTCNVQDAYRPDDSDFSSVSPTGHFEECLSAEGAFDLTGNLWEWSNKRLDSDRDARFYHSAGWRTLAERHRDTDQVCTVETFLRGFSARSYFGEFVGFRCCRDDE